MPSHRRHTVGSRAQVWHGTAKKTSGGLTKADLMMNKHGRIVSRAKHNTAKRENRLLKLGFGTRKGHFGVVRLKTRGRGRGRSRSYRGGGPANVGDSYMIADVQPQHFSPGERAALAGGRRRSRRSRSRSRRGGGPANVGDSYMIAGVQPQHFSPGERAALSGGRRRRRRGSRRSRSHRRR